MAHALYFNIFINKKINKMKKQILSEELRRMQKLAGIITEGHYLNEGVRSIDYKTFKKVEGDYIKATDLVVGETRVAANMFYDSREQLDQNSGVVSKIVGDKVTYELNNGQLKAWDLADLILVTNF